LNALLRKNSKITVSEQFSSKEAILGYTLLFNPGNIYLCGVLPNGLTDLWCW